MKNSIYIVTIHGTDHVVRATGKRAAQQAAIDDRITTRIATADDIVRICRSNTTIIGEVADPDTTQADLIDNAVAAFNYDKAEAE